MARVRVYPQLVVFKEKHGDNYYLLASAEAELKMYLDVLTSRFKENWYSWMKDYKPYGKAPLYTKDDISKMPDIMVDEKKKLLLELIKWEKAEKEASLIRREYASMEKAVETKDGKLAHELISNNSDGEYEGYEYVSFTHIK